MRKGCFPWGVTTLLLAMTPSLRAQQLFTEGEPIGTNAEPSRYAALADLDGDGDLDAITAGLDDLASESPPWVAQPFRIYRNDDLGAFVDATAQLLGSSPNKAVAQFAIGDVNGDRRLDVFVPDAQADAFDWLLIQQSNGTFVDESAQRLGSMTSTASAARFADFDSDGDLDLLVIDGKGPEPDVAKLLLNDGTGHFTPGSEPPPLYPSNDTLRIELFDLNRDFAIDVLIVGEDSMTFWGNAGGGVFAQVGIDFPGGSSAVSGIPAVCDLDGDADIDLWVPEEGGYQFDALWMCADPFTFTDVTATSVSGDVDRFDMGAACIDVDSDDDFDVAVLGQFSEKGRVFIGQLGSFQNAEGFPASMTAIGAFDFGDVDGDGRIDALIGSAHVPASPARIFRGSPAMAVDTVPPRIYRVQQSVDPASPTAIRFAISDNTATDAGPRLGRAYVKLGAAELEATYAGADLFQATLSAAPQTPELAYTACAVDMRGNESCVPVNSGGSAGTSGTGGTANGGVGGTRAAGGGSGASGSAGSAGSAPSAEDPATSTDGGCGCRSVRAPRSAMFELFVVAAAIAFVRRRR